jgi:pyruvate/2-oxoglutarate dehydrogenase complex dihydrolipoamide acyltransferase (E2) component
MERGERRGLESDPCRCAREEDGKVKHNQGNYEVTRNPKMRRWLSAAFRSVRDRPMMHGLIEVDVTRARALLREHKEKTGESLSFTAFVISCLGRAVDENKAVQAFRKGNKQLVLFEDVDVYTLIERAVAGQKLPIPYIVRDANRKTPRELHQEIRTAQVQDVEESLKWLEAMPAFLFKPFLWAFVRAGRRYPQVWKKYTGTVGLTAVGMFGEGAGWGIPPALPTLMITLGGIGEKLLVIDGHIATRDCLSLTISLDHDVIDGAPAARFTERLKELIEGGYGLPGSTLEPGLSAREPRLESADAVR